MKLGHMSKANMAPMHILIMIQELFFLETVEELAKYSTFSSASGFESDLKKLRRLEDFNNKVIEINETLSRNPVKAELIWKNGKNTLKISANIKFNLTGKYKYINMFAFLIEKRKKAALDGFNAWGGEYTVFGGQKINVEMDINEVQNGPFAVIVDIMDESELLEKLPCGLDQLNTSMSWGGTLPNIYDWEIRGPKVIMLRSDDKNVAMHEFGHSLGLGDAYGPGIFGPGVNASLYPDLVKSAQEGGYNENDFVMNHNDPVRNNDIEMVILAFATGNRQNYQKQFSWDSVSEALGKGN